MKLSEKLEKLTEELPYENRCEECDTNLGVFSGNRSAISSSKCVDCANETLQERVKPNAIMENWEHEDEEDVPSYGMRNPDNW